MLVNETLSDLKDSGPAPGKTHKLEMTNCGSLRAHLRVSLHPKHPANPDNTPLSNAVNRPVRARGCGVDWITIKDVCAKTQIF